MTIRPKALMQAAGVLLFLVLVPSIARVQEQKGPIAAPRKGEAQQYIIKKGDTLWDVSNAFLKDPFLWPFIWKANLYITNPDLIYPGNKLEIRLKLF